MPYSLNESPAIQKERQCNCWVSLILGHEQADFKVTLTFFKLNVHILKIMKYADISSISTNSIVPSHNHAPALVHWILAINKIHLTGQICWLTQLLLECLCPASLNSVVVQLDWTSCADTQKINLQWGREGNRVTVRTPGPPPLTKMSSRQP